MRKVIFIPLSLLHQKIMSSSLQRCCPPHGMQWLQGGLFAKPCSDRNLQGCQQHVKLTVINKMQFTTDNYLLNAVLYSELTHINLVHLRTCLTSWSHLTKQQTSDHIIVINKQVLELYSYITFIGVFWYLINCT